MKNNLESGHGRDGPNQYRADLLLWFPSARLANLLLPPWNIGLQWSEKNTYGGIGFHRWTYKALNAPAELPQTWHMLSPNVSSAHHVSTVPPRSHLRNINPCVYVCARAYVRACVSVCRCGPVFCTRPVWDVGLLGCRGYDYLIIYLWSIHVLLSYST